MTHRHLPLFLMLVVLSGPASADIVFSNFGPGNSYDPSGGFFVSGATSTNGFVEPAMAFTPSSNFTLTQIDVGISHSAATNSVMLSLNSDSGGLPGGAIESWSLTGLPTFGSTSNTVQTVMPVSSVSLVFGAQYWLVASAGASDAIDLWNTNSIGSIGLLAENVGSGFLPVLGDTPGAFDVLGSPTAVPEPTSLVLLAAVLSVVGLALRRRVRHSLK